MRYLVAAFLLICTQPLSAQNSAPRPNVVVIVTDDQRFDLLGCAGHPILKTPHIDSIARRGVRFRNAFATTPICAASRASILTGLYERTHKFTFTTPPIAAEFCAISYPFLLQRAGYRTGIFGKFGVSVAAGQGPRMFDQMSNLGPPFMKTLPGMTEKRHIDQIATDLAIGFLKRVGKNQPFCLSLGFNSPHAEDGKLDNLYPWPKTVNGLYDDAKIPDPPLLDERYFNDLPKFLQTSLNKKRWYWQFDTPEKAVKNIRAYYRMISGIDHEIGRLLGELGRLGLADNTILIFISDNGYFLGERGLSGKWVHYEESLRVPLILCDPRRPAADRGRTVDAMALNIDLAPTILDLAGLPASDKHQGRSLVPWLGGPSPTAWRTDFFSEHLFAHVDIPKWEGVRGERHVYARYFEQKPVFEFLHDLQEDPQETRNLAADPTHAETLTRMRRRCDELREAYGGPYSPERFPTLKKKTVSGGK